MTRPLLLDLFCCEGGAAVGYDRAGFDVIGVDIVPQPRYPFEFHQADALDLLAEMAHNRTTKGFDAIHASPPCQGYSTITPDQSKHERSIGPVRDLLRRIGLPYVIENVAGAKWDMDHPILVCGSGLGLKVRRHRWFESNAALLGVPCAHGLQGRPIGVYGDHPQDDSEYRRPDGTRRGSKATTVDHGRAVMGMPWASWHGLSQAIPPAYTEHIGRQLLAAVEAAA